MSDVSHSDRIPKTKHPIYKNYSHMIYRCHSEKSPRYKEWGGRGITVCQQWRDDFWAFVEYMGPKPSDKHSIDRIDNNGNYEPGNVRWATTKEQSRNRKSQLFLTHNGKTQCLIEWAEELKMNYTCLRERIMRGYSVEQVLDGEYKTSSRTHKRRGWMYKGKWTPVNVLAAQFGIDKQVLVSRYKAGWDVERAISYKKTTP